LSKGKRIIRLSLRRLAYLNYHTARLYFLRRLRRSAGDPDKEVLVYQMGKVGSVTLVASLKAADPRLRVFHVHTLTNEGRRRAEDVFRRAWRHRTMPPDSVWRSGYLMGRIHRSHWRRPWTVITLVRDPVARNISSFFQVLDTELRYGYESRVREIGVEAVVRELQESFIDMYTQHDMPPTWFDTELKTVFGVDAFAEEFPRQKGYRIYRAPQANVLVIKLEKIEGCAADAVQEFLGIDGLRLIHKNIGTEKYYSEGYGLFRKTVSLPDRYLRRMYDSKMVRHFYSPEEIEAFRTRWSS
jgi:hypothetical protein